MEVPKIILVAIGGVLIAATGLLYVKVSRSESPSVDPAALAKAENEYKAGSTSRPSPKPLDRSDRSDRDVAPTPSPPTPQRPEPRAVSEKPTGKSLTLPSTHPTSEPDDQTEESYEDRRKRVNHLYDRRRFQQARTKALALLEERPDDRRMVRVVVSASCIMYEPDVAREYFQKLPERDKKTMRIRCARYEVDNLD